VDELLAGGLRQGHGWRWMALVDMIQNMGIEMTAAVRSMVWIDHREAKLFNVEISREGWPA
jgi:hypothetical protein